MSHWKVLYGTSEDGDPIALICDDEGYIGVASNHHVCNHNGHVFHFSYFFPSTADDAEILMLLVCGSNKDLHMMGVDAVLEGTWELAMYENPSVSSNGTELDGYAGPICSNRFKDTASDATLYSTPTIVNTTVDAESAAGQKVLNVTATAGFETGHIICIDDGESGQKEFAEIDTIQENVSLTLVDNLANTYTNENVYALGRRMAYTHSEGGGKHDMAPSSAETGGEFILKSGEKYLFRMINRSGDAARASNIMWWAEEDKQT